MTCILCDGYGNVILRNRAGHTSTAYCPYCPSGQKKIADAESKGKKAIKPLTKRGLGKMYKEAQAGS